jgi:hypothetical protein
MYVSNELETFKYHEKWRVGISRWNTYILFLGVAADLMEIMTQM